MRRVATIDPDKHRQAKKRLPSAGETMNETKFNATVIACGEEGVDATIHLVNALTAEAMQDKHPACLRIIVPCLLEKPKHLNMLEHIPQGNKDCKDYFRCPDIELTLFDITCDIIDDFTPPFRKHGLFLGRQDLCATDMSLLSPFLSNQLDETLSEAIGDESSCYIIVGKAEGTNTFPMFQSFAFLQDALAKDQRIALFCHVKEPINTKMFLKCIDKRMPGRLCIAKDTYALALAMHAYLTAIPGTSAYEALLQVSPEALEQQRSLPLAIEEKIAQRLRLACILLFELYPQFGSQTNKYGLEKLRDSVSLARYGANRQFTYPTLRKEFLDPFYTLLERESFFCKCMHELTTPTSQQRFDAGTIYALAGFQNNEEPERRFLLSSVFINKSDEDTATLASIIDNIKIDKGMTFKTLMHRLYTAVGKRRI